VRLLRIVPDDTKFDFMRFRRISFPVSAMLSIIAIVLYFFHGLNFGIDFIGGTLMSPRCGQRSVRCSSANFNCNNSARRTTC
jgi:preprotein translocase subunit SecF